jgi:tRNA (guanosine-2'-O-)-methyltransferase
VAPLWVSYTANLGTLLRTCDAVGACMAVPTSTHYRRALGQGDTLGPRRRPHIHWASPTVDRWITAMAGSGWQIVAVEIADDAIPLPSVEPARQPSIVLLGHEHNGVPEDWIAKADLRVAIPMVGVGASLNVAVAGSLVLYRMAGLA